MKLHILSSETIVANSDTDDGCIWLKHVVVREGDNKQFALRTEV
jgi:hypothetical protein